MSIFEIISAIVLIIACVFIVVVVLMKDTKTQMSQTISGTAGDSFYQKNAGRTKEAMLNKSTIVAVVIFFVLAVAVNIINVYFGGSKDNQGDSGSNAPVNSSNSVVISSSDSSSDSEASDSEDSEASDSEASGSEDSESSDNEESGSNSSDSSDSSDNSENSESSGNSDSSEG